MIRQMKAAAAVKSILVISPDPGTRIVLKNLLEAPGKRIVHVAATAQEAIRRLASDGPFQLALSDYTLPDCHGLEMIRQIRRLHPQTSLVFITEDTDWEQYLTAMDEGAFDYLPKSLCLGELMRTVDRALSGERPAMQAAFSAA